MSSLEHCVVLVADDEPTVLQLVSFALRRHGYEVIPASDGVSAVRACEEHEGPIHLAVLDVVMPGLSGPEVFNLVQKLYPKIEVLFMSGYQPVRIAGLAPALHEPHFISKPFLPRELVHRVNTILGNNDICVLLDDVTESAPA